MKTPVMNNIRQLITGGQLDEAIRLLDGHIEAHPADDEAYYLRGNAYRKKGDFRQALNNYLEAIGRNPQSPAAEAYDILIKILDYNNNDIYNP